MEYKTFAAEIKAVDEDKGEVTAYIAAFGNVDHQGDRILKGAFAKSLSQRPSIPMLSQHDAHGPANQAVIGKWTKGVEDEHGLLMSGKVALKTQAGREHFELMREGMLNQFSIGYQTVDADYESVEGKSVRNLKEIDLHEGSVVIFPANEQATLVGVKRDFTQAERDRAASEGVAMPDGSFPIANVEDLRNAIHAIGRAKDPEAAKAHIRKRARALGAEDELPEDWKSDDIDFALAVIEEFLVKSNLEGFEAKAGSRNSAADQSRIQLMHDMAQQMHDHADALGAKCVPTDNDGDDSYDAAEAYNKTLRLSMSVPDFVTLVAKTVVERI